MDIMFGKPNMKDARIPTLCVINEGSIQNRDYLSKEDFKLRDKSVTPPNKRRFAVTNFTGSVSYVKANSDSDVISNDNVVNLNGESDSNCNITLPEIRISNIDDDNDVSDSNNNAVGINSVSVSPPTSKRHSSAPDLTYKADCDLDRLKLTTGKLKLNTRRSSYMLWQNKHLQEFRHRERPAILDNHSDDRLTEERKQKIDDALQWLREELHAMRSQDQDLARQLLSLRHDIHQVKLMRSCEEHKEMLEDVKQELEECQQFQEISDDPLMDSLNEPLLRNLGVTRMNLSARRFSTC